MHRSFLFLALLNVFAVPLEAGEVQPSHLERTECKLQDRTDAIVEYVSMKMNGRKIFGGVVPYGKPWGMGDPRPPAFTAGTDLMVGGQDVPAGKYNLVILPRPDQWTLIFQRVSGQGKPAGTGEAPKIDLRVKKLPSSQESFTILFDQLRGGCVLNLRWEESEASVLLARK